ncbi:sigma-54-dependent transcriptional regulator [Candidatus Poribacteria bacterium]
MRNLRILVVDDEEDIRTILSDRLEMYEYEVLTAADGMEALEKVEEASPDLVLLDILLPKLDGMEVLSRMKDKHPEIPVIMITAHLTVERVVEAMLEQGAYDFFEKPLNFELLMVKIRRALELQELVRESEHLRSELKGEYSQIIGNSQGIIDVLKTTERFASSGLDVLITGETGTGKELVARAVYSGGKGVQGPFIPVNCSAIPEGLAESLFFGSVKGVHTDAVDREGYLELADSGTLFLDEIGDMPLDLQPKLLRAIQEKEFMKLGGKAPVKVDVRLIAATNQDLPKAMENGKFREDLFYRLDGFLKIAIPPLRERQEDIPLLVKYFLQNAALDKRDVTITDEAMELLMDYHWPGNVRELQGCIVNAIVLADSNIIGPADLPSAVKSSGPSISTQTGIHVRPGTPWKVLERELILKTLDAVGGDREKTCKLIGISKRTLENRLKKYRDEGYL